MPANPREFCISPRTAVTWEGDATDHLTSTHPAACIPAHRRAQAPLALLLIMMVGLSAVRPGGCARTGVAGTSDADPCHYDLFPGSRTILASGRMPSHDSPQAIRTSPWCEKFAPHSSTAYHDLLTQKLKNSDTSVDVFFSWM